MLVIMWSSVLLLRGMGDGSTSGNAIVAVPVVVFAAPATYLLLWAAIDFRGRVFGLGLALWVTMMLATMAIVAMRASG